MERDFRNENENYKNSVKARSEKFKNEGLRFSEEDRMNQFSNERIFERAFAKFINECTQDEVQPFIDQLSNIQDQFHFLQDNDKHNLCAVVLTSIQDTNRKTNVLRALFDAGLDYSFLKKNGVLFLYSDHAASTMFTNSSYTNITEICQPFLQAILHSKNHDNFLEAVKDLHLGQSGISHPDRYSVVLPHYISIGVKSASDYLSDNQVIGKEVLKPFYEDLTNPESALSNYCSDIQYQADRNTREIQRLSEIVAAGSQTFGEQMVLEARVNSATLYETLQVGVENFKGEYQKVNSLLNTAGNIVNGVIIDKKSITDLPIPTGLKDNLAERYNDTIHPEKREAYLQEQSKLDQLAKFTEPQISPNKGDQAAKNKTQSKQDIQDKNTVKRSRSL